ncbi:helix-turn-helix domain-containing protein [Saccharibacillus sp. O23]|uniref:helix-turn-helix domain-containing protein n=1 Tax=Saccharibacillus sp. O23 TaxID=2009338 RepID=UPI0015C615DA|nr:helix-turn-helix domain-containing protein [Saccharibacillus sp. O23]
MKNANTENDERTPDERPNRPSDSPPAAFFEDRELLLRLAQSRQDERLHHDLPAERKMLRYVREGRYEELTEFLTDWNRREDFGILSRSSMLRHQKNLTICGITLYTRAAIEGGLNAEIAFTLSDLLIQRLEELRTLEEVNELSTAALREFARRVRDAREHSVSGTFEACRQYIFNHLYEELPLARVGRAIGLNPAYLSRLCKQETGLSLSAYIRREKVEEAKRLLELQEYGLSEICALLGFNDQSHFTQVFKTWAGVTPGTYRKRIPKKN